MTSRRCAAPTCLECERIRRRLDDKPDGEHVCGTCGDVWCLISGAAFDDGADAVDVAEKVYNARAKT